MTSMVDAGTYALTRETLRPAAGANRQVRTPIGALVHRPRVA